MLAGERIGILRQVLDRLKARFCSGSGVPLGSNARQDQKKRGFVVEVGVVAEKNVACIPARLAVASRRRRRHHYSSFSLCAEELNGECRGGGGALSAEVCRTTTAACGPP
jgi:hypothetical protein